MKHIVSIFTFLVITLSALCQAPNKISYQAVIRNSSNNLITNQLVGIRISIIQASPLGNAVYMETHTPTSNSNGLISIEIGGGVLVSGNFSIINWANGPYFIKTETDPSGGANYTIIGTSQLLSVPYALYAKEAGNSSPGPQGPAGINGANGKNNLVKATTEPAGVNCVNGGIKLEYGLDVNNNDTLDVTEINLTLTKYLCNGETGATGPQGPSGNDRFTHYIGEEFGGGVIFHLWKDSANVEHGLIVSLLNQSNSHSWSNVYTTLIGDSAQSSWDGLVNSNVIVRQSGHNISAAKLCLDFVADNYNDWYLPSIDELSLMWHSRFNINKTLSKIVGATILPTSAIYWSSTEDDYITARVFFFYNGDANSRSKEFTFNVRAIRAF